MKNHAKMLKPESSPNRTKRFITSLRAGVHMQSQRTSLSEPLKQLKTKSANTKQPPP